MKRIKQFEKSGRLLVIATAVAAGLAACNHDNAASPAAPTQASQAKKAATLQAPQGLQVKAVTKTTPDFPSIAEIKSFLTGDLIAKAETPSGLKVVNTKSNAPAASAPNSDEKPVTLKSGLKVICNSKTGRCRILNLGGVGLKLTRKSNDPNDTDDINAYLSNADIYLKTSRFLQKEPRHVFELYKHVYARVRIPGQYEGLGFSEQDGFGNVAAAKASLGIMEKLRLAYGAKLANLTFEELDHDLDDPKITEIVWPAGRKMEFDGMESNLNEISNIIQRLSHDTSAPARSMRTPPM